MKKRKITSAFAVMSLMSVVTAFAINPFSDVSSDSWAYQAVDQLAIAGIINGYPDGTFKGQNNITRYEMAQMIAKGLANQDRANAEQQALLNRLTDEFSNELNTLGVRVAKLEDRVGKVKITGDARINYIGKEGIDGYDYEDKFTTRVRLGLDAKVNKNTSVKARITTGSIEFGDSSKTAQADWDLAYVEHKFGKNVIVDAGRYTQKFGNGLIYSSNFDGVGATAKLGNVTLNGAYGYMTAGRFAKVSKDDNGDVGLVNARVQIGKHFDVGAMLAHVGKANVRMSNGKRNNDFDNVYGFNAKYNLGQFGVEGEWVKASGVSDSDVWNVGVKWGEYKIDKKNSWTVHLDYFDQAKNAPVFKTQKYESNDLQKNKRFEGYKAWQLSASYAPEKNVGINAYYGFHAKTHEGNKVNDYYRADLNFKF
ncbi:putative porin [Veillonella rodentium]|uniref:Uncharacterized protein conserved in bacteria n=1 Tax=Veillonella rodentium TaxID=248315 RepID=A0A239YEM3_9FIRM|nr:putative porin [Veillonella rodentium]SNV56846.1 Uncharacterized protein conserved in bacteria [Veillonella rodentium]